MRLRWRGKADVEGAKANADAEFRKADANPANGPSGLLMSRSNAVLNGFKFGVSPGGGSGRS
jgi:hypothetical protein